jgi:hypothetical protein
MFCYLPITLQAATPKPAPCSTEQYRHFDFWIGNWEVKGPKGKVVGHSEIKSILNGCALSESWSSTTGYKGVSYNFFDGARDNWHQTWIGGAGGALYLNGNLKDAKMVLKGQSLTKDGATVAQKITWTPIKDGRVSQHWQVSKDDGKTWTTSFMGYYNKK